MQPTTRATTPSAPTPPQPEPEPALAKSPADEARDILRGLVILIPIGLWVGRMGWVSWTTLLELGLTGIGSVHINYWRIRHPRSTPPVHLSTRRVLYLVAIGCALAVGLGLALALVAVLFVTGHGPVRLSSGRNVAATAPASQRRDDAYWTEIGTRVLHYMAQKAGAQYTKELGVGLAPWLQSHPDVLRQYEDGDDMKREAIVDQYLEKVLARQSSNPKVVTPK
jgi:hypothetical protein